MTNDQFSSGDGPAVRREVEELAQIRADARALGAEAGAALDPSVTYTATDATGTVEVTVDGDGAPTGLRFTRPWRRTLGIDGLESAVLEALTLAGQERLVKWATRLAEQGPQVEVPPEEPSSGDAPRGPAYGPETLLQLTDQLLDEFDVRLAAVEGQLTGERTHASQDGRITVKVQGGAVSGLTIDRRLPSSAEATLSEDLRNALAVALKTPDTPQTRAMQSTVDQLNELVQTLLRSI